jgi:hypothetical protein
MDDDLISVKSSASKYDKYSLRFENKISNSNFKKS